jgi:hypothetical protein
MHSNARLANYNLLSQFLLPLTLHPPGFLDLMRLIARLADW